MTREEKMNRMQELETQADADIKAYNALIIDGKIPEDKLHQSITEAINEYTGIARSIAFEECAESENPMHEACERLYFDTIRAQDVPIEQGSKVKVKKIVPAVKVIDLKKLAKFCKSQKVEFGEDSSWIYAVEKLNFLLTAQKAKDLGLDPAEIYNCYAMRDISKQYDLGKNPTSNTNLLKTLQRVVSMMIGEEYKAVSHDVKYLMSIYSKKGKAELAVACANQNHFRQNIQEICHRILTGKSYSVEFKRAKK